MKKYPKWSLFSKQVTIDNYSAAAAIIRVDGDEKTFPCIVNIYCQLPETTTTDYDAKEIEFRCPCGECSVETYLKGSCPESGIPYLGMNTLSEGDKKNLNYILKKDTKKIMESFRNLSDKTCDSLKRQGVTIDNLVRVAINSNPSLHDKLIGSTSVDQVFSHLAPEMSFFNHEVLRRIINVLGDINDTDRLSDYSREFKQFCKRKVFEVEPGPCTCGQRLSQLKGRKLFAIVLPTGGETLQNLGDAVSIQEILADDLDIPLDTLHLHRIDRGSIILVFSVPDSFAKELFPLPKEKIALLRVKGMLLFVPQDPKSKSNLVEDIIITHPLACRADKHGHLSKYTPIVSSGTPRKLLVSHSHQKQLSWTPDKIITANDDAPYDVEPGLCVIINNMEFTRAPRLPGGKKDEEKLAVLFTTLGFEVKTHRNLTGKEISNTVESYSTRKHSGAFFLAILSHGTSIDNRPAVLGTDRTAVVVSNLEHFFYASKCKSLKGIPKIFLIDACRGGQKENAFHPLDSAATQSDSADFLIIHAAADGNAAFTTDEGSYLTQMFVEVTLKADKADSLRDIVTRVGHKIQYLNARQTVESTNRLTHKYLIKSNTPILRIQELQAKFDTQVQEWTPFHNVTIKEIEKTIEKLKEHHKNIKIACITGVSTVDTFLQEPNVKCIQDLLACDHKLLDKISKTARKLREEIDYVRKKCTTCEFATVFEEIFIIIQGVSQTTNVVLRLAELATMEKGAVALAQGVDSPGIAAAITVLNMKPQPINLAQIIAMSFKGSQTTAIEKLTNTVKQLKEQKKVIEALQI